MPAPMPLPGDDARKQPVAQRQSQMHIQRVAVVQVIHNQAAVAGLDGLAGGRIGGQTNIMLIAGFLPAIPPPEIPVADPRNDRLAYPPAVISSSCRASG